MVVPIRTHTANVETDEGPSNGDGSEDPSLAFTDNPQWIESLEVTPTGVWIQLRGDKERFVTKTEIEEQCKR